MKQKKGRRVIKTNPNKINKEIRQREVRLVGDNIENGVYDTSVAMDMADEQNLDLVLISDKSDPVICKIMDYSKHLYDMGKNKPKPSKIVQKEMRFGPNTDDHDFDTKLKHIEKFIKKGNRVKAYVFFKGREIRFKDRGEVMLLKLADALKEIAVPEGMPRLEGKKMNIFFRPLK